jgi:hypothetical protein
MKLGYATGCHEKGSVRSHQTKELVGLNRFACEMYNWNVRTVPCVLKGELAYVVGFIVLAQGCTDLPKV